MSTGTIDQTKRPRVLDAVTARVRAIADTGSARSESCLNCGTALTGPFCAQCGQRDVPPYPTVRELAVDAFWELSGWDGRFAATVRALVRQPGKLTREFLEGRRARYLSPLRLYLMASLVYFVLAAAAPDVRLNNGKVVLSELTVGTQTRSTGRRSRPQRAADAAGEAVATGKELSPEKKAEALKAADAAPKVMRPLLHRLITDPVGFKRGLLETMPRLLFALLPAFAAIVALFYRGRRYPEHLYFSIHLHSFVFLALAIPKLTQFTHFIPLIATVGVIATLAVPIYTAMAFRRVYGGSVLRTIAKQIAIGVIYACVSLVAFMFALYWVAVMG